MNKKIIFTIILAIILLGGILYFGFKNKITNEIENQNSNVGSQVVIDNSDIYASDFTGSVDDQAPLSEDSIVPSQ